MTVKYAIASDGILLQYLLDTSQKKTVQEIAVVFRLSRQILLDEHSN